jgi:hypothetical protein
MNYIGEWILIPELSLYASGSPPIAGRYAIVRDDDGRLAVDVTWRMPKDAADRQTRFGGVPDGSLVALPVSDAGPDSFALTHVADDTLDSAAFRADQRVAYARRVVSADSTLLAVVQEIIGADGTPVRNFQVYRRAAG